MSSQIEILESGVMDWRQTLRESLRGGTASLTEGSLGRALMVLAVPMVLEMVLESVFAVVDIFFVSRLGAPAMAAVGITESLLALIYTIAGGLSIGVTAVVARRMGERDPDGAAVAAVQAAALGVLASAIIGIAAGIHAPALLRLMGAGPEVVRAGAGYATIMLGGNAAIMLLFLFNAAFRGAGDATVAMRVLWLANGINLVLDPCLIFGLGPFPELGVAGAAVATTIGRGAAVLAQVVTAVRWSGRLRIRKRHLRISARVMAGVVRLSAAGTVQTFIATASWIGLVRVLAGFGSAALAGYTIAIRLVIFAMLPAWGLANAAATMVGQNLGAGRPDRAERSVWIAGAMNLSLLGVIGSVFLLAAPQLVALFGVDPDTARHAIHGLRILGAGFVLYGLGLVLEQAFNGAGAAWTPTALNFVCFWLIEIPLAWLLAIRIGMGADGVFTAIAVAFSVLTVISGVLFRRGRWKQARV